MLTDNQIRKAYEKVVTNQPGHPGQAMTDLQVLNARLFLDACQEIQPPIGFTDDRSFAVEEWELPDAIPVWSRL